MATKLSLQLQEADWKTEKHVPVIDCPDRVKAGQLFQISAVIGKEIGHPNTTEHHIRWIALYFHPAGEKFTYQLGRFEFTAHGESAEGPDKGPVHTHHQVSAWVQTNKPGVIHATSYCNIHGLWQSQKEIALS